MNERFKEVDIKIENAIEKSTQEISEEIQELTKVIQKKQIEQYRKLNNKIINGQQEFKRYKAKVKKGVEDLAVAVS